MDSSSEKNDDTIQRNVEPDFTLILESKPRMIMNKEEIGKQIIRLLKEGHRASDLCKKCNMPLSLLHRYIGAAVVEELEADK